MLRPTLSIGWSKNGLDTDDSDDDELAFPLGNMHDADTITCIFCDELVSSDVRGDVSIECYNCGDSALSKCAEMEKKVFIWVL